MNIELKEVNKITIYREFTVSHNVDPQKGFSPVCPDELVIPDGHNIVDELNGQNSLTKYKTVSKDVHPENALWIATPEKPQLSSVGHPNVDVRWVRHCQSGTRGVELLDGLPHMTEYDFFVAKGFEPDLHPYSSIYHDVAKTISTGIIEWYIQHNITTVIVGGLALNVEQLPLCVGETLMDLSKAGFQVILNLGATRGLGSEEGLTKFLTTLQDDHNILIVKSYKDIQVI